MMADEFSEVYIRSIVSEAAHIWSLKRGATWRVSEEAKNLLIHRALEHADAIQVELDSGRANREQILDAALAQFDTALDATSSSNVHFLRVDPFGVVLSAESVLAGLSWKCNWIPWC